MKPHWTVFALLGLSILLNPFFVSAADGVLDNDPNGFKGYSWDTTSEQFDGLVLWGKSDDISESKTYYLPNEPLTLGDVKVEKILYSFYGDKFKRVTIKYHDGENYDGLVSALTARFGAGLNESRFSHDVSWVGKHTHMILRYDDEYNIGVLVVSQLEHRPR
jgi:hypothetical protein